MTSNIDIVRDFINATNNRDWPTAKSLLNPEVIRHSSSEPKEIRTSDALIEFHKQELNSFPDLQETILMIIAEGDIVAARLNFVGTQMGPMGKYPATGRTLDANFNCFFKVLDGVITDTWVEYDNLNGLIQLGHYEP